MAKVIASKKKNKALSQVPRAQVHVHASFNNTILTLTDMNGNTLAWSSAGHMGFKGPKKSTPFAASQVTENLVQKAQTFGVKEINVFSSGIGSGRDSAIRTLNSAGLNILSVKDVTPTPHNGCRARRPRRL
ncbi:30S ribosomal protein S11 [Candidatus Uhrbacteria bacterium RIFCSPLOWO2_01_FULL_53_9]|uniref:Small ribosomal subunit protein uS11 n=3 Tax=Candidatus Uhriibacteriota TaxID=1752732 RepID=A0A1F7UZP5_9BACT|nr:MAG: 30S ribosomal protein S11 [Candidatus Uhrbacteria bacterium RIFCSPHIGHO2_02_FULL_53_13]OGL83227.1 MAG: 30S ribosomal protein S11 [Candidatus Uhrbacteria bacterium RIFCSPLOWO2_01_FULL_53_9]OGL89177.1 MAG: 30S ribosomal protein S11 [Candidatus Uhrbacteria bacterium RIFCSPLOWO2_02_FULL_53_10]